MTRFRFGSRNVLGQRANAPGRVAGILPQNAGVAPVVQAQIDTLTAAASRRYKEAISGIDAVPLYIFQRLTTGTPCNCGAGEGQPEEPDNPHTLGIVEDDIDSVSSFKERLNVKTYDVSGYDRHVANVQSSRVFNEDDILGEDTVTSTSGSTDPYAPNSSSNGPYSGQTHGYGDLHLHAGSYDHEIPDAVENTYGDVELLEGWEDGWNPDSILADSAYVLGALLSICPVCMGTGLIGGYSLVGATRLVFSSGNYTGGENSGAEAPQESSLPVFTLQPGDTVEWEYKNFPNYFKPGWYIARNMRSRVNVAISYSNDGRATWKPISQLGNDSAANLSSVVFKVENDTSNIIEFSHFEIVVIHTDVLGQVTNFNQTAGLEEAIKGEGITITIPPEVGQINRNSLIAEAKYKLIWRVLTVTPIMTADRQLINCETPTELLKPAMVETILYPEYSIDLPTQMIYGNGVEPIQGER